MGVKRGGRLAAPFVVTLAVGACARNGGGNDPAPPPTAEPPRPTATLATNPPPPTAEPPPTAPTAAPPPTTSASADPAAEGVIYDGFGSCYHYVGGEKKYVPKCPESLLPEAPKDALVYEYGGYCRSVPAGRPVRCPPGGVSLVLPTTTSKNNVFLQLGTMKCKEGHTMHCPKGASCNPPPPTPVPCPAELLPKLAPGVKPTRREGANCFYGEVQVACTTP